MNRVFLLIAISFSLHSKAQPYVEGGKTRHRFAQLNVGFDFRTFSASGTHSGLINTLGVLESYKLKEHSQFRFIIGGTHFWGQVDFYISVPIFSLQKSEFNTGVETGAKYFPWRLEHNKIRPYLGVSLLSTQFKQDDGATALRFKYPVLAGLNYCRKNQLVELGCGFILNNSENYFVSTTSSMKIRTNQFWFSLGYKLMFETSLSAERDWQSGRTKWLTDTLSSLNKLDGFVFSTGFSSVFFLESSEHNTFSLPFIDNHKSTVFPEFGIGYYFHKPDLQFNLIYRSIKSEINAYGFSQIAKRKALTFEAYKFLFDFNGFAFFAGGALSSEKLTVSEMNQYHFSIVNSFIGMRPGITFGWDIRPNRLQAFYLRTTLRYFPELNVKMYDGYNFSFDELEFNFIQLVLFPGRLF